MITMATQKIKKINLIRELERYPIFNLKKLKEIIEKDNKYSKLVVYRLKKEKLIFEIEKNKYTTKKDSFIIASNIIWPSYISCWSALRYYNLTEQLPQITCVITTRKRKKREINFNNLNIKFIKTRPRYFFGYKKERYMDFNIFIAEREKALIDSALFKKISFLEIYEIIKNNIKDLDMNLFILYLIKIKNKALIKRFGFLFNKLGIEMPNKLEKLIDFKYVPLDYALKSKGKKDKKWRIIENVRL